jgi:hypothetical protein
MGLQKGHKIGGQNTCEPFHFLKNTPFLKYKKPSILLSAANVLASNLWGQFHVGT